MTPKEFRKYLDRDVSCPHCGVSDETLVPQHRKNRGFGGSKERNSPANIMVMCSAFNGLIESSAEAAELARKFGWKLESWENPLEIPILADGQYWLLDNNFGRFVLLNYDE